MGMEEHRLTRFSSIDEVPSYVLRDVILGVLRRYGQTTDQELIKAAARELGFQRVGNRIAAKIGRRITELIAAKIVRRADDDSPLRLVKTQSPADNQNGGGSLHLFP